jgi:hypothetical protein
VAYRAVMMACATLLLAAVGLGEEEKYELKESYEEGGVETADSLVELQVDITFKMEKREGKLPMKIRAVQKYVQKTLKADARGRPVKAARHFEKSTMEIRHPAGEPKSGSTAYEGKTYIIEKDRDTAKAELLGGKEVSKEEAAELSVAVAGNTHKLLPGKPVEVGASWEAPLDAIREVFNIPGKAEGKATARLAEVKEHEGEKSAVVKIELEMKVPQAELVFLYKGQGRVDFSLKHKRITSYAFSAKIEVSGSQQSEHGKVEYGGEGTAKTWFKTAPGKGEIDLAPPEKEEPKEKDKQEEPAGKDPGK